MIRLFAACLAGLLSAPSMAQIYSYTDAAGRTVYTDQPPTTGNSQEVRVKPTNRMPAGQRFVKLKPPPELAAQLAPDPPLYKALELIQPADDATLRNTGRSLDINVSSTPALQDGHRYQALLDGVVYGPPSNNASWLLTEIDRGSHQLQVQLLDENGEVLLQTDTVRFHMHQTSLAERRRINPCRDDDYGQRPECPLSDKPVKTKPWWRMGL